MTKPQREEWSAIVKTARDQPDHRMSQRRFALATGLHYRTIQNWEEGRPPDTAQLTRFLDYLRAHDMGDLADRSLYALGLLAKGRSLARPFLDRLLPWLTAPRPQAA